MRRIPIVNFLAIAAGAAIAGAGINALNIANGLAEGGVTGIAVLIKLTMGWDPGVMSFLLNLPLFYVGWRALGRQAMLYTIYGTVCLSVSLTAFGWLRLPLSDLLLVSLFAGALVGLGLGVIFRFGGTTGGVDIVARMAGRRWGWPIGRTMFLVDLGVVALSLVYLSVERAMYTVVAVFVAGRVIDLVQEAAYSARGVTIVSERARAVTARIMGEMHRGVTVLGGAGGWSGEPKEILWVVVPRSEVTAVKRLVGEIDPDAFISVGVVNEVVGEGFQAA